MNKQQILEALKAASDAPGAPASGPTGGCGRAYVCVSADRKTVNAIAAACKTLGLTFLRKAYGTAGNAIYLGYDNATGRVLARAKAFADKLREHGISCYDDAVAD